MRLPDWEKRLNAFLESRREAVFSWGENDCGKFCFEAIEVMTGEYPCPYDWTTEEEAMALINAHGSVKRFVSSFMGRTKGALCARRGDMAVTRDGSLGIAVGARVATPTRYGLTFAPLSEYTRCWMVD